MCVCVCVCVCVCLHMTSPIEATVWCVFTDQSNRSHAHGVCVVCLHMTSPIEAMLTIQKHRHECRANRYDVVGRAAIHLE